MLLGVLGVGEWVFLDFKWLGVEFVFVIGVWVLFVGFGSLFFLVGFCVCG